MAITTDYDHCHRERCFADPDAIDPVGRTRRLWLVGVGIGARAVVIAGAAPAQMLHCADPSKAEESGRN
jgi:hypothetical protein